MPVLLNHPVYGAELYERKTISIFNPANTYLIDSYKKALIDLGRFDYYPVTAPPSSEIKYFIQAVVDYGKKHAKDQAQSRTLPDLKFKTTIVTKQDVEKIMNSAYIFFPVWNLSPMDISSPKIENKPKEISKDKNGKEVVAKEERTITTIKVTSSFNLNTDIYDNQFNKVDTIVSSTHLQKEIVKEILKTDSKETREQKDDKFKQELNEAENSSPEKYFADKIESSQDTLNSSQAFQLRSLDMFMIKSKILNFDRNRDVVIMKFGNDQGIGLDQSYKIIQKEEVSGQIKNNEIGFLKTRSILNGQTELQPIILKDDISEGEQLIEYPKSGFNARIKSGMYPGINPFGSSQSYGAGVSLGGEWDLAETLGLSELYTVFDANGIYTPGSPILGLLFDIGLEKKFFIRQFGIVLGAKAVMGGGFGHIGTISSVYSGSYAGAPEDSSVYLSGFSGGGNLSLGLDYHIEVDTIISLEAGYNFMAPIDKWSTSTSWEKASYTYGSSDDTENKSKIYHELDTDLLNNKPSAVNLNGLTLKLGIKCLF